MNERLRIGVLHLNIEHGAIAKNRASLLRHVEKAAEKGARIILAPELAISGYSFDGREDVSPYVEEIPGSTVGALSEIARRFGVYVCTGLAEVQRRTGIFYNSAVVVGPDGTVVAHHRKHVAERRWSCPGQPSPKSIFETPWGKVGVLICADSYYGLLPRSMALQGADLLLVCANWPSIPLDPREIWRARVLENGVGLIAANRTGFDRRIDYSTAHSYAIAPDGTVLLDSTSNDSRVFIIDYPLDGKHFPSRLRKGIMLKRSPHDYNAIALDTSGMEDFQSMWGLPPAGRLSVHCVVPHPERYSPSKSLLEALIADNETPRLLVLPLLTDVSFIEELVHLSSREKIAVVAEIQSAKESSTIAFISEGHLSYLLPTQNWTIKDFSCARIALIRSEAVIHPEQVVSLSKQGCDILVTQVPALNDDLRLILGVKSLEQIAVVAISTDGAIICVPPKGHERWHEIVVKGSGSCEMEIDTSLTRKKRFLDRVDLEVLLSR